MDDTRYIGPNLHHEVSVHSYFSPVVSPGKFFVWISSVFYSRISPGKFFVWISSVFYSRISPESVPELDSMER